VLSTRTVRVSRDVMEKYPTMEGIRLFFSGIFV